MLNRVIVVQKNKLLRLMLTLTFILLNIQVLTIFGLQFDNPFPIKIYHVFSLVIFAYVLSTNRFRIKIFETKAFVFFSFSLIISLITFLLFGVINKVFINYVFAIIVLLFAFQFYRIGKAAIIISLQRAFIVVLILIVFKNIFYIDEIIEFFQAPFGHPVIPYFYGGGANLESSWIAICTMLFISNKKKFYILTLVSIIISIAYSSRIGFILTIIGFLLYLFSAYTSKKEKISFVLISSLFLTAFIILYFDELKQIFFIFDRFSRIGSDAGSTGRLSMWSGILPAAVDNYFFAYGAGNSIIAIQPYVSRVIHEDNIHMYYLQNVLEFGLIGASLFFLVIINFFVKTFKNKSVLKYCFYLYLIGCFIQFRGAEPIIWFLYGLIFIENRNE